MQLQKSLKKLTTTLAVAGALSVTAQVQLDDVVVTATRTETEIRHVGKSVDVITREQIEKTQHTRLIDVLRTVPGLQIAQNGPHGNSSIFLRGSESYHTKVLINGTPATDPSGTQATTNALAYIDVNNIERIEILKGAQTVLYGTDAIGGVINIITRKGAEELSGDVRFEAGEADHQRTSAALRGGNDFLNFSVSGNFVTEDGPSAVSLAGQEDSDDYEQWSIDGRLSMNLSETFKLNLSANHLSSDFEYDTTYKPATSSQFRTGTHDQGIYRSELAWLDSDANNWNGYASFSIVDSERNLNGYRANGITRRWEVQHSHKITEKQQWTGGLVHNDQISYVANSADSTTKEAYLQDQITVTDQLTLTGGARIIDHDAFGNHTTWQISSAWSNDDATRRIHASIGTGFRAPSVFELYSFYGDPSLAPEESFSMDLGIDQFIGDSWQIGATVFKNKVDDLIDYDFGTSKYNNISESQQQGVETYLEYAPTEDLQFRATYTYLDAENSDTKQELARRPDHTVTVNANWQATEILNLNADMRYASNTFSSSGEFGRISAYTVVNLASTVQIQENLQLFIRVENVFDEDYELVNGYSTYGRTFYGGVSLSF